MEEIGMEAAKTMPVWLDMFLAIIAALGGWEAVKYLMSLRANRRKDKAEADEADAVAHQQAATAGERDADWRQKELELMTSFVETAKVQYDDLTRRYDELRHEKDEDRRIKAELRSELRRYEREVLENTRKIEGLQRAFTEEVARRRYVERLYCSIEKCVKRRPPLGTFSLDEQKN